MMLKVLILALAIAAVSARPQPVASPDHHGPHTGGADVDGVHYPELPLDGNCESGVTYYHYGNLCYCKSSDEITCKRIKS